MWKIVLTLSSELLVWANASDEPEWRNPITGIAACCARAASGHAAATPPSAASNSRCPMVTVIRPSRARCVNEGYRHERAVLTERHPAEAGRTPGTGCNGAPPGPPLRLISRDYFRPGRFTSSRAWGRCCRARFSLRATSRLASITGQGGEAALL